MPVLLHAPARSLSSLACSNRSACPVTPNCSPRPRRSLSRGRGRDAVKDGTNYHSCNGNHHGSTIGGLKKTNGRRGAGFNHLTVVIREGEVVVWGFNSPCRGANASVHSEVNALRALFSHLKRAGRGERRHRRRGRGSGRQYQHVDGFDLLNVRFTFDSLRISRPCRRCWLFLRKHLWRFRRVMYTTSEGVVICMSAEEFAAEPTDHVSKGHRLEYYTRKTGSSVGGSGSCHVPPVCSNC